MTDSSPTPAPAVAESVPSGPPSLWDTREIHDPPPARWPLSFLTLLLYLFYVLLLMMWVDWLFPRDVMHIISRLGPFMLEINAALILAGFVLNVGDLRSLLGRVTQAAKVWLGLITLGGFLTLFLLVPRTHRIYYDEDIYGIIGLSMATNGLAIMPTEAEWKHGYYQINGTPLNEQSDFQETTLGHYNKQPNALPFVFSLIYRLFGPNEMLSHLANNLAVGANILLIFLVAWLLFERESLALYAAFIFATIPNSLRWGNSMAVEPMASSFISLTIFCALFYCLQPKKSRLVLLASISAFTVQFRPETLMVGLVVLLILFFYRRKEFRGNRLYLAGLLFLILLPHHWVHLHLVRSNSWGAEGDKFSISFFWTDGRRGQAGPTPDPTPIGLREALTTGEWRDGNLSKNIRFFFGDPLDRFPPIYACLFVLGLACGGTFLVFSDWNLRRFGEFFREFFIRGSPWKQKFVAILWFTLFWGVFLFFYAGSYYYGADDRFSLLCFAPVAILAGVGAETIERFFALFMSGRAARILIAFGLVFVFSRYLAVARAMGQEAWLARADHDWAVEIGQKLPPNSVVFSNNPSIFNLYNISAAQIRLVKEYPDKVENYIKRFPGKVFLHWGFWQAVDVNHRQFAQSGRDNFECVEVYHQRVQVDIYVYEFWFYRMDARKIVPPPNTPEARPEGQTDAPEKKEEGGPEQAVTTAPTSLPPEAKQDEKEEGKSYIGPPQRKNQ